MIDMPYIKPEIREALKNGTHFPETPGELNYVLSLICFEFVQEHETVDYQVLNDVLGALEGSKQEFYRRVVVPFEESKIKENGDIYQ